MTTLTVLPEYPVPGRACSLVFGVSAGNHVKVWISKAPAGSATRKKLDAGGESQVFLYAGDGGSDHPVSFTPDKGGVYTLVVQESTKGASTYGGAYEGDEKGYDTESLGTSTTLTLQVGQRVTQKVGKSPDSATLALWVFGDTVRPTTVPVHGEATPGLTAASGSTRAGIAVESPAVQDAVNALADQAVSLVLGDLAAIVADYATCLNIHFGTSGSVHHAADTQNQIPVGAYTSVSPKDLPGVVSQILNALRQHYKNDDSGKTDGVVPGPDSAAFHQLSGVKKNDALNLPIFDSVGDLETAYGALADIHRSYEAHRISTLVHGAPDPTFLGALPDVLKVHEAFISVLASIAPPVPPTINSGVVTAVSVAGFKET